MDSANMAKIIIFTFGIGMSFASTTELLKLIIKKYKVTL